MNRRKLYGLHRTLDYIYTGLHFLDLFLRQISRVNHHERFPGKFGQGKTSRGGEQNARWREKSTHQNNRNFKTRSNK